MIEEAGECFNGICGSSGIAVDESTGDVYVANRSFPERIDIFNPPPTTRSPPTSTTEKPLPTPTAALLRGTINPDGVATTECKFEWGTTRNSEHEIPALEGDVFNGNDDNPVSAQSPASRRAALPLPPQGQKRERLRRLRANGSSSARTNADLGKVCQRLNTDGARINADSTRTGHDDLPLRIRDRRRPTAQVGPIVDPPVHRGRLPGRPDCSPGLTPGPNTTTARRDNDAGEVASAGPPLHDLPHVPVVVDPCETRSPASRPARRCCPTAGPTSSPRPTTAAATTSSRTWSRDRPRSTATRWPTAGSSTESTTAASRVSGNPTNHGVDPYVATRSDTGWTTKYVGIPANGTPVRPFASTLLAADDDLDSLRLRRPEICAPCFADGSRRNPGPRTRDGQLVQGMAGSLDPDAGATPDGLDRARRSRPTAAIWSSARPSSSSPTATTTPATSRSTTATSSAGSPRSSRSRPTATTFPAYRGREPVSSPGDGDGIAELAISADGSRIVVAQQVSNRLRRQPVLAPLHAHRQLRRDRRPRSGHDNRRPLQRHDRGRLEGLRHDQGLSSPVTTATRSADIYEAAIGGCRAGHAALVTIDERRLRQQLRLLRTDRRTGTPSRVGPTAPPSPLPAAPASPRTQGSFYFASPEQLDGSDGIADQANLYVVEPGGSPEFVTTIDSSVGKPGPAPPSRPVVNNESRSATSKRRKRSPSTRAPATSM